MTESQTRQEAETLGNGIYLHIPFCRSRCIYCHFVSFPYSGSTADRYVQALSRELIQFWRNVRKPIDTIYFGGGTPSLLDAEQIADILKLCREICQVSESCEVSLETNPGIILSQQAMGLKKAGINRISLGAQSFWDSELKAIGRAHSAKTIGESLICLKGSGFDNINLDLMLGIPGQNRQSWKHTLDRATSWQVPHISVYMLDLDEPCFLRELVEAGSVTLPEDDLVSDLYLETIELLIARGYEQYEISNFAYPGYACRHNMKYWNQEGVYGFGVASHSFDGNSRWANFPELTRYFEAIDNNQPPRLWEEQLSMERKLQEALFLGLRKTAGVNWKTIKEKFGLLNLQRYEAEINGWVQRGLICKSGDYLKLNPLGMVICNELFQHFI